MKNKFVTVAAVQSAVSQDLKVNLDKTIRFPDQIVQSTTDSSKKHIKSFGSYQVIVPIKRQGNNWIAASAWKNSGSKSVHKQFFLEKLINHFLELLSQKTRLP